MITYQPLTPPYLHDKLDDAPQPLIYGPLTVKGSTPVGDAISDANYPVVLLHGVIPSLLVVNCITIRRYKKIAGDGTSYQGTDIGPLHRCQLLQRFVVGPGKQHSDGNLILSRRIRFTSIHDDLLLNIVMILRFNDRTVKAVMSLYYYH
ncbi:hypothetical protein ACFLV6_01690 [Chloroflexota bacterium]